MWHSNQKKLDRRSLVKLIGLGITAKLASGCTPSLGALEAPSDQLATHPQNNYSDEPFDVRTVDRRKFSSDMLPTKVSHSFDYPPGSLVIDTQRRQLFLIETATEALRYGVAVGDAGYSWTGKAFVGRKSKWPAWHPTTSMRAETPDLPHRIAPGADNPLGARALYLYKDGVDTLYRVHGTSEPWTIGTRASSGCIRMFNEDVIDLYDRVSIGATVVVI